MASERILIVDDEEDIRQILSRALQNCGFETATADGPAAALDAVKKLQPHVVITDIKMQGMDGVELGRWVKEHSPGTSVIMMTGYASADSAIDSLRLGADDYFKKPVPLGDLADAVRAALDRQAEAKKDGGVGVKLEGDVLRLEVRLKHDGLAGEKLAVDSVRVPSDAPDVDRNQRIVHLTAVTDVARQRSSQPEVAIDRFPFRIGRAHSLLEENSGPVNDLTIRDERPYQVSRSHCLIERVGHRLFIRDCDSRLGTVANGERLGAQCKSLTAELKQGENRIVLGHESSPYQYTLVVDSR